MASLWLGLKKIIYWSGTESNTKRQVSIALSHISWVLYQSETNCIAEG